jgi:hypothetical protein
MTWEYQCSGWKTKFGTVVTKVDIRYGRRSPALSSGKKKKKIPSAEINNENAQSDRISTMKMPKVIDFLGTRAAEFLILTNRSPTILYLPWLRPMIFIT